MSYFYQLHTNPDVHTSFVNCLKTIRAYDPSAYAQVICENELDAEQRDFVDANADQVHYCGPLNTRKAWTALRFELAIDIKKDVCIKLSPHCRMWRKPYYVPIADYFGSSAYLVNMPERYRDDFTMYIRGACVGTSLSFMQKVLDDDLVSLHQTPLIMAPSESDAETLSIQRMVAKLGLIIVNWDEVAISDPMAASSTPNSLVNGVPRFAMTCTHSERQNAKTKTQY